MDYACQIVNCNYSWTWTSEYFFFTALVFQNTFFPLNFQWNGNPYKRHLILFSEICIGKPYINSLVEVYCLPPTHVKTQSQKAYIANLLVFLFINHIIRVFMEVLAYERERERRRRRRREDNDGGWKISMKICLFLEENLMT